MEAELLTLLILHILGVAVFGKFESETAWWRIVVKWTILVLLTYLFHFYRGHTGAFVLIGVTASAGLSFHFYWCIKNGIHPLNATPRKKYYALRHWTWNE
jgi:hypothetical protein